MDEPFFQDTLRPVREFNWVRRGPSLGFAELSAVTAVFDPATGETHFLNELPRMLLDVVAAKSVPAEALMHAISAGETLDADEQGRVWDALRFLEEAELVTAISPCSAGHESGGRN